MTGPFTAQPETPGVAGGQIREDISVWNTEVSNEVVGGLCGEGYWLD